MPTSVLSEDRLTVAGSGPLRPIGAEDGIGRRTWMRAEGHCRASYRATLAVDRPAVAIGGLAASPLPDLPAEVVPYLWPSRYCEADRFEAFVEQDLRRPWTAAPRSRPWPNGSGARWTM